MVNENEEEKRRKDITSKLKYSFTIKSCNLSVICLVNAFGRAGLKLNSRVSFK